MDWVLVWKKGIVGGRERSSYAAPELRFPPSIALERRFSDMVVAVDIRFPVSVDSV